MDRTAIYILKRKRKLKRLGVLARLFLLRFFRLCRWLRLWDRLEEIGFMRGEEKVGRKKIDLVCETAEGVWIIEVEPKLSIDHRWSSDCV